MCGITRCQIRLCIANLCAWCMVKKEITLKNTLRQSWTILYFWKKNPPPLIRGTIAHDLDVSCEISMVNGKMVDLIKGDCGSFCHYCDVTRDEANNLELIFQPREKWTMLWVNGQERSTAFCQPPLKAKIIRLLSEAVIPSWVRSDTYMVWKQCMFCKPLLLLKNKSMRRLQSCVV